MKKKVVGLICCLLTCMMMFTACGNKEFDLSKEAYQYINTSYEMVDEFSSDVYNAWYAGIYDDDSLSISYLAGELNLEEEELAKGMALINLGDDYENASEEEIQEEMDDAESSFDSLLWYVDNKFDACLWLVSSAYEATGKTAEIQTNLDLAKDIMKTMSEKYSDYEHYPSLKEYYTKTSSYFEFCQNPTGSFEQVKTTMQEYEDEIRDYVSDLDYIFED